MYSMASSVAAQSVTDYYLTIQALTPVQESGNSPSVVSSPNAWQIPTLSVLVFLGVLIIGAFGLLLTKSHQLNKMMVLITLAFVLSAVPLGLRSLNQNTHYQSQAGVPLPPTQVVITQPSTNAFTVSWHTDKPDLGALRVSPDPQFSQAWVVNEPGTIPGTEHLVTLNHLQPKTTYYLHILSGSSWYDNHGQPIVVTTAQP